MYTGCGKGKKRFGVLEGLRKLRLYCQDIEQTYEAMLGTSFAYNLVLISDGNKLSYGDPEPWKKLVPVYGTTHPSRKLKAIQSARNDGRAPDTTAKLVSVGGQNKTPKSSKPFQYLRNELHPDGLRLFTDWSFQSYPWNGKSSCWFDTGMEAMFFCFLHCPDQMQSKLKQYGTTSLDFSFLLSHIITRLEVYKLAQDIPALQEKLFELRNQLALELGLNLLQDSNPVVHSNLRVLIIYYRPGSHA